jgi:hypothetical protein
VGLCRLGGGILELIPQAICILTTVTTISEGALLSNMWVCLCSLSKLSQGLVVRTVFGVVVCNVVFVGCMPIVVLCIL